MAGLFDDLVPQQAAPQAPPPGLFDDLIPKKGDSAIPSDFKGLVVPMTPPKSNAPPQKDFAGVQPGTLVPGSQTAQAPATPDQGTPVTPSTGEALGRGAVTGATMNWGDELAGLNAASGMQGSDTTMGLVPMAVGAGKMIGAGIREKGYPTPVVGADIGGTMPDLTGVQPGPEAGDAETQARYEAAREKELAANEAARAAHPTAFFAGELGGGVATLPVAPELAAFKVAKNAPLITKALKSGANLATAGAGYGAVAGAGGAEEGQRLQGAATGAVQGAVLAPALGGAFKAVGAGAGYVGSHLSSFGSGGANRIAMRAIQDALEADGTNLQEAIIRLRQAQAQGQQLTLADVAGANTRSLASSASRYPGPAKQQIREFLNRRQFGDEATGAPSQHARVSEQVGETLGKADKGSYLGSLGAQRRMRAEPLFTASFRNTDPVWNPALQELSTRPIVQSAIKDASRVAANEGRPLAETTFDAAGRPVAANAAETFAAGSRDRLDGTLKQVFGDRGTLAEGDRIVAERKAESGPFYKEADAARITPVEDIPMDLLDRLEAVGAFQKAAQIAKEEGKPFDIGSLKSWDYMKKALDTKIDKAKRKGDNGAVMRWGSLKKEMLSVLDKTSPAYAKARQIYAGHSEMLDALAAGKKALGKTREEVEREVADLGTDGERAAYRQGFGNALREKLSKTSDNSDLPHAIAGNDQIRTKTAVIAGPQGAQAMDAAIANEGQQFAQAMTPNLRGWHYALESLDQKLLPFIDKETGEVTSAEGQAIKESRDALRASLENGRPEYAAALREKGSITDSTAALQKGQNVWSTTVGSDQIRRTISTMSEQEAEAFRIGAADALRNKLGNAVAGADRARMALGRPEIAEKMSALAPDPASRAAFKGFLENETSMVRLRNEATGGASTAMNLAADAEAVRHIRDAPHIIGSLMGGNPGPLLSAVATHLAKVNPVLRGKVLKSIADIAVNPNPQTVQAFADLIAKAPMKEGTRQRVIAAVMKQLPRTAVVNAHGRADQQANQPEPEPAVQ